MAALALAHTARLSLSRSLPQAARPSLQLCKCALNSQARQVEPPNVPQLCEKARLSLTPEEIADFTPQIANVVDWFAQLQDVDVGNVAPAIRIGEVDLASSLRADVPVVFQEGRHCQFKRLPVYIVSASSSGTITLGLELKTCYIPKFQVDSRKAVVALSCLTDSTSLKKNSTKPLSCGVKPALIKGVFRRQGLVLDFREEATGRFLSSQTEGSRKKAQVSPQATAGDSSSVNPSSSTPSEEKATDGTTSSSARSFRHPWLSKLKEVDWNKLVFNCRKDEQLWTVPWSGQTIFQVMLLWFAAFWVMGSWVLPIAAQLAGFSRHNLSFRGQAVYSLITDIAEGVVGLWILKRCLRQFVPLPKGWFPVNMDGNWLWEASWGCVLFPFVNRLSKLNLYLIPLPPLSASYVEQSMMSRDPVATLLYAIVISVCAPIWEEVIFRGFLLPSMTRYMSLWGAIFVSAIAFALAHFSLQRVLPLTFLGLVMGFVFVRSKNLVASIILHSLWNGFAFLELL